MTKLKRKGPDKEKKSRPQLTRRRNDKLVASSVVGRCFGVGIMAISRWRRELGLPHWRVRSDQNEQGYLFVYDLDEVEQWAQETNRVFDRKLAFAGMRPPNRGERMSMHRQPKPKQIPRIPRDEQVSP